MNWDHPKARVYDHLHQAGEITQDFADVIDSIPECKLQQIYYDGSWDLVFPGTVTVIVKNISQVLLILHAVGIEVEWPKNGVF
jgi:hypothetical protein